MSGAQFWIEVVCHDCARNGPGRFVRGGRIPVRQMLDEARKDGFRQRTSGDFECRKCTEAGLEKLRQMTGEPTP